MSEQLLGGWTGFRAPLTAEAKKAFDEAMHGLVGVVYTPVAFASQVVAGINYCYLCNAKGVYPGARESAAMVHIYQPLPGQGHAHVTSIKPINP
jgi:hypothetical protein